jgi:hypothetical protein
MAAEFARTRSVKFTATDGTLYWQRAEDIRQVRYHTDGRTIIRLNTAAEIEVKTPDYMTLCQLVDASCDSANAYL